MSVSSSSRSSENKPAFTGHIANTLDALLIFEACRRGSLPRIQSRLSEPERRNIKSGDVYVFGEEESKIKRWTDGRRWSPSRIMNNFLIYKELEPSEKELKKSMSFIPANNDTDALDEAQPSGSSTIKRERSQSRFGDDMFDGPPSFPSTPAAREKVSQIPLPGVVLQGGLIKKTISVGGLHMISYYNPADMKTGSLKTPSSVEELASLEINHIFLLAKYFRHPPQVAFGEDGMPRFVALTDEDPMPRKNSTSTSTAMGKKVKQESTTSSRHDERRPDGGAGSRTDNAGQSFFPKSEPQDDIFPEDFGSSDPGLAHIPPLANRRSSTGYSSGGKYRTVPGLARSLSSASESTTTAVGEAQELPPSMRPRTGSSSGGRRHEPYRLPMSRGSSTTTSPSTYHAHPHPGVNLKSPRHSFSMEYSPNMTHLRHSQRTDIMYTEGIGRHLRSASLSSGLGVPSSRGSITSSPSIHAQIGIVNENAVAATSSPHSTPYQGQSPYFDSQHSYTAYSSPYMAQRPYTSPDGSAPEQAMQGNYMANAPTEQMYNLPTAEVLEQQINTEEEHARRLSMTYSPNMQAQVAWSGYHGGYDPYGHHATHQQAQYDHGLAQYMDPQQANTSFGLPAGLPHTAEQQQADSVFMSGQQPYPMGEFIQHHHPTERIVNESDGNMARNAIFQYYPPSSSSMVQQHSIPLLRTEFSPLMPASASYPSSLSSFHSQPQVLQQGEQETYQQAPEDQQQAGLGLHHHPAPPSYSHQQAYPANLGKAKIDYKVVEPVSWPIYTSPKVVQHQYQPQAHPYQGVHPSQLHPDHPDIG